MFKQFSDFSPQLLLTDSKNIIILDTATGNETIVAEGYNYVFSLAYHQSKDFIFWCDSYEGTISRYVNLENDFVFYSSEQ